MFIIIGNTPHSDFFLNIKLMQVSRIFEKLWTNPIVYFNIVHVNAHHVLISSPIYCVMKHPKKKVQIHVISLNQSIAQLATQLNRLSKKRNTDNQRRIFKLFINILKKHSIFEENKFVCCIFFTIHKESISWKYSGLYCVCRHRESLGTRMTSAKGRSRVVR